MSPTMTIPIPALPARSSEPPSGGSESDSGGAFTDALQRAQAEPRPERASTARGHERKATEPQARPTRHAQAAGDARDGVQRLDTATRDEPDACAAADDATAVDVASRSGVTDETAIPAAPPAIAFDATMALPPAGDIGRVTRVQAESDRSSLAVDGSRAAARAGPNGAPELRLACALPDRSAAADEPADRRGAATLPLPTLPERTADDSAGAPARSTHAPTFERAPLDALAPALAANLAAREPGAVAAAHGADTRLPQATLHAAIDEPGFGAAVGHQVALWVRDGVQEARLQLHPAELGPVTVQIALEGQAAHVDFTAAVAATRESIEQSLPALAATLRESGFTLAGGGVSSGGQRGADAQREHRRAGGAGNRSRIDSGVDGSSAVAAPPRRWSRSLVDVYA